MISPNPATFNFKCEEEASITSGSKDDLKSMSVDDLESLLNEVLEQEDYIRAIAIRDELNNRRK